MHDPSFSEWLLLVGVCAGVALLAVWLLSPRRRGDETRRSLISREQSCDVVLLFDEDQLIDGTGTALRLFDAEPGLFGWSQQHDALKEEFPDFPKAPEIVREQGNMHLRSRQPGGRFHSLSCEWLDGIIRVHLNAKGSVAGSWVLQISDDKSGPGAASDTAPYPIWRTDGQGQVVWCNKAYSELANRVRGGDDRMDDPLFPSCTKSQLAGRKSRFAVPAPKQNAKLWFDVSAVDQDDGQLFYAVDVNAVVDAETAQRNFVQTLAKTFAQLSIGLAIFDRNRQLALFNPALVDLTSLPADFLSARPDLLSFFDRLRDQNMMPEPKNYGGWRQQMADLVEAAADGKYQETWSLPSGSVYSVSGRPHPDGAVAFLFEDITAEITLTRRFRSELELGHAVLDRLSEAICVFEADGNLAFSNTAYRRLWNVDPDLSFAQTTVLDATRTWQGLSQATPVWGEVRDFIASRENRADWWARVELRTGETLICEVSPVQNGATMVSFRTATGEAGRNDGISAVSLAATDPA